MPSPPPILGYQHNLPSGLKWPRIGFLGKGSQCHVPLLVFHQIRIFCISRNLAGFAGNSALPHENNPNGWCDLANAKWQPSRSHWSPVRARASANRSCSQYQPKAPARLFLEVEVPPRWGVGLVLLPQRRSSKLAAGTLATYQGLKIIRYKVAGCRYTVKGPSQHR